MTMVLDQGGFKALKELAAEGCICPVGFGQVRDPTCPQHGKRFPAHTITGL